MKWTEEQTVNFVREYIKYKCLYDVHCDEFRIKPLRNAALLELSLSVCIKDFGPKQAYRKIRSLKSTYSQELKKVRDSKRSGAGTRGIYIPNVKWYKILHDALLEVNSPEECRETLSNFDQPDPVPRNHKYRTNATFKRSVLSTRPKTADDGTRSRTTNNGDVTMASIDISTASSQFSAPEEHKRTVDEVTLNKLKGLVERLRLDNATLKKSLDVERSEVRALKARHDSTIRNMKTEYRKKEETLEKQLRIKPNKLDEELGNSRLVEAKKLTTEIQSLKSANKGLQEKLKVAQAAESARASELRAQAARHDALEQAARRDARAQWHKLLEEIKSKERVNIQLRREMARMATALDQAPKMECGASEMNRKLRIEQNKERSDRDDLNTDIQHRKETFYREAPSASDEDSAVSSAPASLSPQPLNDMWPCGQCRSSTERAAASARECTRLSDALRDARDQLELMEFRLLELEDASPDKGARDNLTDSDSGCVSPGSRIKDSASPELKRMDSGYKSPHTPSSPCNPRRHLHPHDDFKEDFAKAQFLADILDRNSETTSDSLKSNPVKEHLEQMILNAASVEDRSCLEQVLMLLYNFQALSSSVSEDECFQAKPKRICDIKTKETDIPSHKIQKAIATVTPYNQKGYKCESLESLCEERKPNILQESGIFEGVETESASTQTEVNDTFECSGELNTEIQRLNSIREKLERQGVRNRTLSTKEDAEGLECRCVKLGKKHKQYYERRLKFLEGKISIYEAAQDVKEAKLAQRLQKEYLLENRIQELESQLSELQDKYERLEEECCELEEIENDTRLHWQQLEMDYELCSAQLRDMTEQRECSRAKAERLMTELTNRECALKSRENELVTRLEKLEKAVPALIAWNVVQVIGASITAGGKRALMNRMGHYGQDTRSVIAQIKLESENYKKDQCGALVAWNDIETGTPPTTLELQHQITELLAEKKQIENQTAHITRTLEKRIKELEEELETAKRQVAATVCGADVKKEKIETKITALEQKIRKEKEEEKLPADPTMGSKIRALLISEQELKSRVAELERRETAYLEMLTQADDMWAEMEGGYKKKIEESQSTEANLKGMIKKLESEKDQFKKCFEPLKKKLREVEESESGMRIALEKAERDTKHLKKQNTHLAAAFGKADLEAKKFESDFKVLDDRFKKEMEQLHKLNKQLDSDLKTQKDASKKTEMSFLGDLECIRKELNRACKNNQDLEVTNSELKEEVESLEKQLSLTQKSLAQCKRKCDEKIKTMSHELSIKTEELEELRSETRRQSFHASRVELKPDRTEYVDEGYSIYTAVPKKTDYGRMHHSMSYITSDTRCSCPSMRSQLVSQLIEDLFDRIHNTVDDDLTRLCKDLASISFRDITFETKAKITNYLLMAISKELVRSIGDADAKTDTEEWQRAVSSMTYTLPPYGHNTNAEDTLSLRLAGNVGVVRGAARLASVSCACAAARLCAARPDLADAVKGCQEEVLDHGDVKIMEEQLANAIESIVNCPSCALGTNAIVWSTDV